ncbi:hypothetical protein Asp14428_28240 [Actinoplanes sp. NBRC 14428]|nr:hypothetical protein Asp14428_28240 [Actinoplanes sp. NBRC 14428]
MELLERDGALAELDRLLADTAGGGRVALVAGEAGAGKSSLAAAFAARVGRRARILSGACDPLLTPRALGPVHDIARQTGGVLRERVAGGERGAVFDALLDELDGPLPGRRAVVVLEDLHWADEATLDLVAFLGRRLAVCRALLLLTYRDDELGPGHQLRAVLAGLPRGPVRRIALPPLSAGAVAELARRAGRPPAAVHSVTGGNPLLVTEVLAGAETGVPATVRDLVLSRLAALSPAARAAAGLVAVVPSHAESALLEGHAEGVEEGLAGGVLTGSADAVGFRHELLRRAVEESLSPVRRAALHAEVLDRLAGRPGVDPARLVHHAHHAGDAASVLRWAPVAARRAAEVGAHRQAAAHYETALRHAAGVTGPARAGLLEAYATVAHLAGLNGEGLGARQEALALREAAGDTVRIGENLRWVSRLAWWSGRTAQAREAGTRAVEVLEAAGPGPQLAMAYSNMAQLDMLADADTALGWGERAVALARELGDLDTEAHARVTIGSFRLQRGDPAGGEELDRVHRTAAAAGLTDHAARALVNRACQAVEWHQPGLAEDVLERALAYTDARDLGGYVRHLLGYRAVLRLARGDWPGAAEDAGQAIAGPDQPGPFRCPAQVTLGRLRSRRGLPGAEEVLGRPRRPRTRRTSCSSSARSRRRWPSTIGSPGIRGGRRPRRSAVTGWRWRRGIRGSPGSWPSGCGARVRRRAATGSRRPTGCCSRATCAARRSSGRGSATTTPAPRRWPAVTTRTRRRPYASWMASARSPPPAASGPSCATGVRRCRGGRARRPRPTRPGSPRGSGRCWSCLPRG